ncbi:50S ribosomal protein L4 [Candidatus Woesearchaeota archaeon]|nr:50S ribosomal protein L4 [Candidatus Woesearchaeota archaeon]
MKLTIISKTAQEAGSIELPEQFNEPVRPDLIRKAVLAIKSNSRQPYGASPEAGKRASAILSKRRRAYRGCYGYGISRTPRKILSRRGRRMNWTGAIAPNTVGGRRAHAPKAQKIWNKKVNIKERRKAIRSAISATVNKEFLESSGADIPDNYPFVIENGFESISKTKQAKDALEKIGLKEKLQKSGKRKVRAGKGKLRGRKYKTRRCALIVVSSSCKIMESAKNIQGIDVVEVKDLNAERLSLGTTPGRITLFTQRAIEQMEKEKMFM